MVKIVKKSQSTVFYVGKVGFYSQEENVLSAGHLIAVLTQLDLPAAMGNDSAYSHGYPKRERSFFCPSREGRRNDGIRNAPPKGK